MTIFIRLGQIVTGLLIIGLLLFNSCMTFRTPDKKVYRYFEERNAAVTINRIPYENYELRYLKMVEMDTNHFIPWSDYEVVKRELLELMFTRPKNEGGLR